MKAHLRLLYTIGVAFPKFTIVEVTDCFELTGAMMFTDFECQQESESEMEIFSGDNLNR